MSSSSLGSSAMNMGTRTGASTSTGTGTGIGPSTGGNELPSRPSLQRQGSSTGTELRALSLDTDEDFARLLASYDVPAAVDALRRYLATEVQSSALGMTSKQQSAQIKRKFYERFNQILDRVVGNDDVSRQQHGGWLDYSTGLSGAASSSSASSSSASAAASAGSTPRGPTLSFEQEVERRLASHVASLTASGRSLVRFLGFQHDDETGSMFQFLFKMVHPVEFKLELDMLPEQSKLSLMSRSAYTSVLFTQLLQKPITKQRLDPRHPVLLVSIKELYLFYFLRHPAMATHQPSSISSEPTTPVASTPTVPSSASVSSSSSPSLASVGGAAAAAGTVGADGIARASSLMGSLSGTFAARPKRRADYSWRSFFVEGMDALTRGDPYNVLLLQYLTVFFPDSSRAVQSRFHGKILQHANLFLHILIEFWLRQNLIVFSEDVQATGAATQYEANAMYRLQPRLTSPFATVHTQTAYMAPSDDLLSSLVLTILHLLSDSFYPAGMEAASNSVAGATAATSSRSRGLPSSMHSSTYVVGSGDGFLTPSVAVLRRPLYDFLRLVFSRAPIGLSPTAFYAIVDVWLAYIQPWHCHRWAGKPSRMESSVSTEKMTYSATWEPFVLANYHFYTTLLGAFIERAKELDFTGGDERALAIMDRVLSVFTPELLAVLQDAAEFLDKNQPYAIPTGTSASRHARQPRASGVHMAATPLSGAPPSASDRSHGLSAAQGQIVTFYCKALGFDGVGVPLHGCYHRDAERVFDKLWTDSGFAGGADVRARPISSSSSTAGAAGSGSTTATWVRPSGETAFERVHRLSRQLRRVFEISDAYVASTVHSRSLQSSSSNEPMEPSRLRTFPYLLTPEGVAQLRRGLRLCSPDDAEYLGDPMLRPICTFEVPFLVRLSFRVSTWLNDQLGLENPYQGKRFVDNLGVDAATDMTSVFRFNLRFLASKPNLQFLSAFLVLLYALFLW